MKAETLYIKREVDGNTEYFPSATDAAKVGSYTYDGKRMGGAPTITATIYYPTPLDRIWTKDEYVELNGERYYVTSIPSSSKDNSTLLYKHEVTFTSRREVLDNTLFFDVVSEDAGTQASDKYRSNQTKFTFGGDISEFVARINSSLAYCGLYNPAGTDKGYYVVVDDGYATDDVHEVSFEDEYLTEVLQLINTTYELDYYWVGNVCHVGKVQNDLTATPIKYGRNDALLSVSKENANYKAIDMITGYGSSDNIPYYYPNDDEYGVAVFETENIAKENVSVDLGTLQKKFGAANAYNTAFVLSKISTEGFSESFPVRTGTSAKGQAYEDIGNKPGDNGTLTISAKFLCVPNCRLDLSQLQITTKYTGDNGLSCRFSGLGFRIIKNGISETKNDLDNKYICDEDGTYEVQAYIDYQFFCGTELPEGVDHYNGEAFFSFDGSVTLSIKDAEGDYVCTQDGKTQIKAADCGITFENTSDDMYATSSYEAYMSQEEEYAGGVKLTAITNIDKAASVTVTGREWIDPSSVLMPSIYRSSKGAERFYYAQNNTHLLPDGSGNYYTFANEYKKGNPHQGSVTYDDIKPTINGIKNSDGELFGEIADVAFDGNDSDVKDSDGNYIHPYFYIKLHKFSGDYGFSLFDHVLASESVKLNLIKSNGCPACSFEVGCDWDDEKNHCYNNVQTDGNGNLKRYRTDYNDYILPTGQGQNQEYNQDSTKEELWICVKKDSSTLGIVMPNASAGFKPQKGDLFVLTGIRPPKVLVTAAEKRLDDALIKYMSENNEDQFNYSIKFSRVFLEEHPDFAKKLNENCKLAVEYDGEVHEVFVSNYTVKVEDDILSEVEVELVNSLEVTQSEIKQMIDAVKGETVKSLSVLANSGSTSSFNASVADKLYLSKLNDDTAQGIITFLQGLKIGDTGNNEITSEGLARLYAYMTYGFNSGLYGEGASIDHKGNAELNSLFVRQFISTPKFVFNEISVTKAEQWNTNGGGTIESVDTETQQITLKLEENDYGSLSEGDICRGIFADIDNAYGSDSTTEGETDESGFVMHRGFFTTYFYVKRIIASEKGKFVFQYGKKSPSTPDPCAYMDFAQYGSFTDEKRQSSMYFSSRGNSYIEVLDGVNTWNVQSASRVARYGYLGGLSIKKKDGGYIYPEGNGIYVQDNVYFGGTLHSLGEIEGLKDKIQETAAYDVSLSQYQSVLTVDDMGNVIGGLYTEDEARTTKQYKVTTAVFVRKGQEILLEEDDGNEDVTEGHYRVLAVSNECTVEIKNSTVFVTAIENIKDGVAGSSDDTDFDYDTMRKMSDCMVTVVVDLEGKTSKTVQMPIRIQHDSLPFMVCDLSNENASVMWNTKDKGYIGFPVETKVSLFYQNTPYKITDLNITVPAGLKASMSISGEAKVITIEADDLTTDSLPSVMKLPVTVTGMYAGATYEYTKELTIMKSADTVIYEIIPSSDSIVADKDGNQTAGSVSCDVYATSSENNRYKLSELPSGFSLKYGYTDSSVSTSVGLGKAVGVTVENKQVIFALYDDSGNVLDRESVPVLSFGKDGKGAEYIFKRTTDGTQPSNPTPTDYATNTAYQSTTTEYIPSGWTDDPTGVDAVNVYEWVCVRTSTNGHWGRFSDPAEYAHYGKHAPSAKTSDDIVTIPTDSKGGALLAFSETVTFDLLVDGRACTLSSVTVDKSTLSNVSCSLSSNKATISCSKGAALGSTAQTLVFKVTGTLEGATYTDYVTVKVVPNVTGEDGDGYEYIYYKSASASAPSTPKRSGGSLTSGWYDDPMSPTESYPYVYVAYRQGKIGEDGTFSAPALFAYKAFDGVPAAKANLKPGIIAVPVSTDGNTLVSGSVSVATSMQAAQRQSTYTIVSQESSTISSNISVSIEQTGGVNKTVTVSWSKGVYVGLSAMYLKLLIWTIFDNMCGKNQSLSDYATLTVTPVVQGNEGDDGVGISSITTYYLISSASSGVTTSTSGWSTATTKPTSSQPYLWSYTHTVYTNGGVYDTSPVVVGNYAKDGQSIKGDTGTRGPIPRTHTGIESGYHYMSGATGEDYVDLVYYNGAWYRCKTTHDSTSTTMVSSYWDKSATTGWTFMATDLLLAETGYIENLRVDDVYITSKGSGEGDTIFIANKNGLTCKSGTFENVTVSGKVTATSGTFGVWAINTTDTCIQSGNTNGNAQHGVGWSDYWGGYGELNLHTEGGGNSTGIKYSAKSSYLTTLLQLTTSGSSGQTGVDITAASGTAIKIATGSSGTAINAASGSFKGLRLPVSSGSVTAGAYGSDFVTVGSGQTVTLSTPGDANKGAVVIIMPTSSGDFKISGKIRVCGTKFSSETVQVGATIHICVCDGNYWSIGYMPFDDY